MASLSSTSELEVLLQRWEEGLRENADPLPILSRIAELVEKETEAYLKMDPDPFDDRHPGRADPQCTLGHLLKALFKNDDFMNKLVNNYVLHRDSRDLNMAACRLLLDVMPGLETSVVFQETEGLVPRLFQWAENSPEPLRSYATGLLAAAMEIQDIAGNFREQNSRLVPLMLQRLWDLRNEEINTQINGLQTPTNTTNENSKIPVNEDACDAPDGECGKKDETKMIRFCDNKLSPFASPKHHVGLNENSNSSWAEMEPLVIGSFQMYPLNKKMRLRLILQYLTPMGEYQELLGYVFEHNALKSILHFINLKVNSDVRLAFEALKYLAALLCHKKFAVEFIGVHGLEQLLAVYRPSIAATGVSMCLYYLAYSEDAMERVCLLSDYVLSELVNYALWLLECSHESGRCHATMFFGLSFHFQRILDLFDSQDGLRKLFNVISTLEVLSIDGQGALFSDDEVFASRQTARHVCVALKRYYEAHLAKKAEQIRRSQNRSQGTCCHSTPLSKASKFSSEVVQENLEIVSLMPFGQKWEPVDKLHELSGITLLLQLIAMTLEWNYSGRAETVRSALDILTVCSVMAKTQLALCEPVRLPEDANPVGMSILLGAAEGEIISDPDVQRAALNVIINCVCGPITRFTGAIGRIVGGSAKKKTTLRSGEDLLTKMWYCVQSHNGIMVLLSLLMVKTPITDADSIRALACKALMGLARCETVKQIVSKLPLFTRGLLQGTKKKPKKAQNSTFKLFSLFQVTGKPLATGLESSIFKINKADVVAQTKIVYHGKELLQLIHQHLLNNGYAESAGVLLREASLPKGPPKIGTSAAPSRLISTPPQAVKLSRIIHSSPALHSPIVPPTASCSRPPGGAPPLVGGSAPPLGPIRVTLACNRPTVVDRAVQRTPGSLRPSVLEKCQTGGGYQQSPIMKRQQLVQGLGNVMVNSGSTVTLDNIVTEYLRKQHALCRNPVITCPPFDLFVPHSCPDPKFRNCAPTNFTARAQRRPLFPPFGGVDGSKMDRKLIFSRFRPVRVYRDIEDDGCFTCGAFSACDQMIALGTYAGELKLYNVYSGQEEASYLCHDSGLTHCEPSKDGRLILTSSSWRRPLSALWNLQGTFEINLRKIITSNLVGLHRIELSEPKEKLHIIYDLTTGQRSLVLRDPDKSNNYTKNRATFSPTDELVLSDGVLWDVLSQTAVHKFDKFNPHINGVFHPSGLEIIANSEIWDLRTFHLLHTVPALDQCQVTFNHQGNVIYGAMHTSEDEVEMEEEQMKSPFGSSFRTFDATDYSNIATIDIRKNIFDLCTDKSDCFLAIIENQTARDGINVESICRLYEVGRLRGEEDEMEEEEEEGDEIGSEDEDDDDDDDNDDDNGDNGDDGENEDEEDEEEEDDDEELTSEASEEDDDVLFALNNL
uniref:DDB1- and CUL4-associated factor 1 n=1 Tax=Strigamia maritima TaxID=126957 RepID=T1J9J0_STRMM